MEAANVTLTEETKGLWDCVDRRRKKSVLCVQTYLRCEGIATEINPGSNRCVPRFETYVAP